MKKAHRYSFLPLVAFATLAAADKPDQERQYTISSPNGEYEFTMFPASSQEKPKPYGEAFRVTPSGEQEPEQRDRPPLWQVTGWYSLQTFISNDGRSLVRMGPWASKPAGEELAVAFYRDGRETQRYVVADLLRDANAVQRSVSHYTWQAPDVDFPRLVDGGKFQLRTIEDRLVTFDVTTGEILDPDPSDGPDFPNLAGTWQSGPCGARLFARTLHLQMDNTFRVLDRNVVSYQGSWHAERPTMIELVPENPDTRDRDPLALLLDFRGDLLYEATPGDPNTCTYSRTSDGTH